MVTEPVVQSSEKPVEPETPKPESSSEPLPEGEQILKDIQDEVGVTPDTVVSKEDETESEPAPEGESEDKPLTVEDPTTYEGWTDKHPNLKATVDVKIQNEREEARRDEQGKFTKTLQGYSKRIQEMGGLAQTAAQGYGKVTEQLRQIIEDGGQPSQDALLGALQHLPAAAQALRALKENTDLTPQMRDFTAAAAERLGGDEGTDFANNFLQRWSNAGAGLDENTNVLLDQFDAYSDGRIKRVTEPLRRRVRELEAANEAAKQKAGEGERPADLGGVPPDANKRSDSDILADPFSDIKEVTRIRAAQLAR